MNRSDLDDNLDSNRMALPSELEERLKTLEDEASMDSLPGTATSIIKRRSSSVANSTRVGLTFKDLPPVIESHIQGSLPATPGFEISKELFENTSNVIPTNQIPQQRRPKLFKNDTARSITRLLKGSFNGSEDIDENVMSFNNPPKNVYRVVGACVWTITIGMNDGVLGAILPDIEAFYGINYALVSLIWLGNAIGYVVIAFTAHMLDDHFGTQKLKASSCFFFVIAFSIIISATKFPVICVGFFFAGMGGAIGLSQFNIFLSRLKNPSKFLGIFHGCYGIGATISPLIGTAMVTIRGIRWSYYYCIPLTLAVFNMFFLYWAFEGCEEDLKKWEFVENTQDQDLETFIEIEQSSIPLNDLSPAEVNKSEVNVEEKHSFKEAMRDWRTWIICCFIFFYQGAEVSLGGWVVTFLLDYRGGDQHSIGYVSSGFWGGVTIGRFTLTHILATKFGARRSIIVLATLIIILDIISWLVPNTIASSVFASFIGICIGPIYPMMISLVTRILPRKIKFCSLTLGTAFGSSGGSAVPFAVGMASQFVGTFILHPIFLGCYTFILCSWIALPNIERTNVKNLWERLW